jgi:kinetochor protein Mis14/NSL1
MADVHRKIELQETDDLRYLINNARRAANQKINDALPPIKGEDTLRQRVEELVHEVCCSPNLEIPLMLSIPAVSN